MTAVLAELDLPTEGPIHFEDIVTFRGGIRNVTSEELAAYHAAEYLARMKPWREAVTAMVESGKPGEESPDTVAALRAANDHHLDRALTAFTAAAALKGWDGRRIGAQLDSGDVIDEMCWQWLGEWLSAPGDEIDSEVLADLIGRLTHVPQRKVPDGQMTLDLSGRTR